MILDFANNAVSTLASSITSSSTSIQVAPGAGALFPNPVVGSEYFKATLTDLLTGLVNEIVHVTARSGDVMTVVRGQEATTAGAYLAGDNFKMLVTAGTMQTLMQVQQSQTGAPNFALDTGTANNYVAALSPAVTARVAGLTVRIKATNANSGASTLNLGAGPIAIVNPDGSALGSGAIVAGGVIEVIDTGSGGYQLISSSQQAQSLAGAATTGAIQWRPTAENLTGWVAANALTLGNAASNATGRANADAANLFGWHWLNFSNTQCPVFTSGGVPTTRGANAAADFAANLQIQVLDLRGTNYMGMDTMGGAATTRLSGVPVTAGNATTPGSILGENLHTLTTAELAAHFHNMFLTDPGHFHNTSDMSYPGAFGLDFGSLNIVLNTSHATTTNTTGITLSDGSGHANQTTATGGGGSHNTVERSMVGYIYIKL